jgi:tetratricopeptide (TPR) repeat protein
MLHIAQDNSFLSILFIGNPGKHEPGIAMKLPSVLVLAFLTLALVAPALGAEEVNQTTNPYYWYNQAVDLAYEGKFSQAMEANDHALALEPEMPLALANKAGVLVQLGRYDEAIGVADRVLVLNETEMPNTLAAASYSRGDALRALGRTAEAKDAYDKAYALDSTLMPPNLATPVPTTRAPLSLLPVLSALFAGAGILARAVRN